MSGDGEEWTPRRARTAESTSANIADLHGVAFLMRHNILPRVIADFTEAIFQNRIAAVAMARDIVNLHYGSKTLLINAAREALIVAFAADEFLSHATRLSFRFFMLGTNPALQVLLDGNVDYKNIHRLEVYGRHLGKHLFESRYNVSVERVLAWYYDFHPPDAELERIAETACNDNTVHLAFNKVVLA